MTRAAGESAASNHSPLQRGESGSFVDELPLPIKPWAG